MGQRTYSSEFKLQVVLEALQSDGTDAEVARAYDVHPVTLSGWKTKLKENGSKAFGGSDELKEKKEKIAKLERMVGQKEVEIALLKNFLGESHARLKRSVSQVSTKKNTDSTGASRRSACQRAPTTTERTARTSPLKRSRN